MHITSTIIMIIIIILMEFKYTDIKRSVFTLRVRVTDQRSCVIAFHQYT